MRYTAYMHQLSTELNAILKGTIIGDALSDFGRRIYYPKGIVAQSAEALAAKVHFNATQGFAATDNVPYTLPAVAEHYPHLQPLHYAGYAPTAGIPELRSQWQQEMRAKNSSLRTPTSLPVVTAGLTAAFALVAELFMDSADTILIPTPYWGNYRLVIHERRGATITGYPLFTAQGKFNAPRLRDHLANSAAEKIICVFNFPHNPTGYTASTDEADVIQSILLDAANSGKKIILIADDAYFGLQYSENSLRESLFARLAAAHANILAIKIDGVTKEEYAWGFRVGFITCAARGLQSHHYDALNKKIMGLIRCSVSNCNRAAQEIMLRSLRDAHHNEHKRELFSLLTERYRAVTEALRSHAADDALRPLPFNSGYFVTLVCQQIDAETLRQRLLAADIGIIAIDERHIRFTYSTIKPQDIPTVIDALYAHAHQ